MKIRPEIGIIFTNLLLSATLTVITNFYFIFNLGSNSKLNDFLLHGKPFLFDYVANGFVLKSLPLLPVLIAWIFIGVFVYFFYFSLTNVYYFIYNQLLIMRYKKTDFGKDRPVNIRVIERLAVHAIVTVSYIFFLLVFSFVLLPLSTKIPPLTEGTFTKLGTTTVFATWSSPLVVLIYWVLLVSLIQVVWHFSKKLEDYETFKNEHESLDQ